MDIVTIIVALMTLCGGVMLYLYNRTLYWTVCVLVFVAFFLTDCPGPHRGYAGEARDAAEYPKYRGERL